MTAGHNTSNLHKSGEGHTDANEQINELALISDKADRTSEHGAKYFNAMIDGRESFYPISRCCIS